MRNGRDRLCSAFLPPSLPPSSRCYVTCIHRSWALTLKRAPVCSRDEAVEAVVAADAIVVVAATVVVLEVVVVVAALQPPLAVLAAVVVAAVVVAVVPLHGRWRRLP